LYRCRPIAIMLEGRPLNGHWSYPNQHHCTVVKAQSVTVLKLHFTDCGATGQDICTAVQCGSVQCGSVQRSNAQCSTCAVQYCIDDFNDSSSHRMAGCNAHGRWFLRIFVFAVYVGRSTGRTKQHSTLPYRLDCCSQSLPTNLTIIVFPAKP
jgi:hypothetical protein